ncbi:Phosphatidylinositol 3,5-bisphosphate-binding protein [Oleoguttula sp. CCFEE 5521]
MNTRHPIQPTDDAVLLSLALSPTRARYIAGLSDGCRIFRTDNCLPTYQPILSQTRRKGKAPAVLSDAGVAVVAVLDDRYFAVTGGGSTPQGSPNVVSFWDATLGRQIARFDLYEPILGIRMSITYATIVLQDRTVMLEYQELSTVEPTEEHPMADEDAVIRAPNKVKGLYPTAPNPYALVCLGKNVLVLPAQTVGQVQLVPLPSGSKRVFRAHDSAIRSLTLSDDGTILATASMNGTLIRVWSTSTLDQLAEFRRGMDHAVIGSLAIGTGNRWLASTSDKSTLHLFDLRPAPSHAATPSAAPKPIPHRRNPSYPTPRIPTPTDQTSLSNFSGRSSPQSITGQGSAQEYYGLRPPPASASPSSSAPLTALAAFKSSSLAPRALKDTRSVASAAFYTGDDPPHWQPALNRGYTYTTSPTGKRTKVRNPVPPLPGNPTGKPPMGIVAFAPKDGKPYGVSGLHGDDDEGAVIFVFGGGGRPRWELFELLPREGGGWGLVGRGYREILGRQFVD